MADPTIFGRPMRCYNPGRGWEIEILSSAGLTIALYIELCPGNCSTVYGLGRRFGECGDRTKIWIAAMVDGRPTRLPHSEIQGLDEHAAARIGEGLLRGFAAELIQGER